MASARLLAKLVTTAGSISGEAVQVMQDHAAAAEHPPNTHPPDPLLVPLDVPGLEMVPPILRLLGATICSASQVDAQSELRVAGYVCRLVRRYGTVRRSIEALATTRRRHPLISIDKSHAWSQAMSVSASAIEPTLQRHAALLVYLSKWIKEQGLDLERKLDAYQHWLDAALEGHDTVGSVGVPVGVAPAVGQAAGAPPVVIGEVERAPAAESEEPTKLIADSAPGPAAAPVFVTDLELILGTILRDKHVADQPGERVITPAQQAALGRLKSAESGVYERAVAAVALRDYQTADAFLSSLEGRIDPHDLAMLRGDRFYMESRFDEALAHYRVARGHRESLDARIAIAASLARAHKGSIDDHFREAIDLLGDTLGAFDEGTTEWARVCAMLAGTKLQAPAGVHQGRRGDVVQRAIELLESALRVFGKETFPYWWAEVNQLLARAWLECPAGDRAENVHRAMQHLEAAGQVWSREADPAHWAALQSDLGHAWERMPRGNRAENIHKAIECFNRALEVRTREQHPVSWARLQSNLGNAWLQLPASGGPGGGAELRQNVEKAVACHMAALEVWSREGRRHEWAATQNNLGNAWALMPTATDAAGLEEREKNLRRAVSFYRAALEVRTRAHNPQEWASTMNNLGTALMNMPIHPPESKRPANKMNPLHEAITCFEKALEVRTRDAHPLEWAKTQTNLGQAYARLTDGDRVENLQEAAAYFENALEVYTAAAHAHQHQHVQARLKEVKEQLRLAEMAK